MSSTTTSNVMPMMHVGLDNFDLVKYLVSQVMLSEEDRFEALKEYYPQAKKEDWRLWQAGQRVQIIKRDAEKGGVLRLGTEVVSDQQGTIAALLGASPGRQPPRRLCWICWKKYLVIAFPARNGRLR